MLRPTGYYVLIEMEEVEEKEEEFVSGSSIILATHKQKQENSTDNERVKGGHDVGVIRAFGPNTYVGFKGIWWFLTVKWRAWQYGIKIGDRVEFNRYDGKVPRDPEYENFRIIQDEHVIGVYDE